MGFDLARSNQVHEILLSAFSRINQTHLSTLLIGVVGILIITVLKKIKKSIPGALIAVIFGVVTVYMLQLNEQGVSIVKTIPSGFPSFVLPDFSLGEFGSLIPLALTISVVAYMEAYSVSKSIEAKKRDYKVMPNQELIALGAANAIGSLFQSFPVTGGFSRSAVNYQSGANTPLASMISAALVALTLIFLTPLFYFLPKAILASVIMVAVSGLIDWKYAIQLWKDSKIEFVLLAITFLVTLNFSMVPGIVSGIIFSILILLYRAAYPHIAVLGRVKSHHGFRNVNRFKDLEKWEDLLIIRMDSPLTFINIQYFKEFILNKINEQPGIKKILLDAGPISHMDASASEGLKDLLRNLKELNIQFFISDLIGPVRDILTKTGMSDEIGQDNIFMDLDEAVNFIKHEKPDAHRSYALQSNV
jgi:SulP family sulfate permease